MEYNQFVTDVSSYIQVKVNKEYEVKVNRVKKNNSVVLDGIVFFKEGDTISPNIYLNSYYSRYMDGESMDTIAEDTIRVYEESKDRQCEPYEEFVFDFDTMKDKITYRLVNYNKNVSLLEEVPHVRFLDLAITFHCLIKQDEEGIGTIRITNEHMVQWDTTVKELMRLADRNTKRLFPIKINTMEEVIAQLIKHDFYQLCADDEELDEEAIDQMIGQMRHNKQDPRMYIVSNQLGINGATSLIYHDAIKEFARKLETDFYILPSSVHEVILVPYEEQMDREELKSMVSEVNRSQVGIEEILSDKVYIYRRETNRIEL